MGYHWYDISAETRGIVVDQATHTVDLLDIGHVRILSLGVLSTSRFPQVIELGLQPAWLVTGPSQMFWNIVEFWMFLLDGAALTVVLLHNAQKLVVPEWRRIRGISQKLNSHLLWLGSPTWIVQGMQEVPSRWPSWKKSKSSLAVLVAVAVLHDDA